MATESPRFIAHLDMDAFYASVELLRYPELKGRAVVIGGARRPAADPQYATDAAQAPPRFATLRGYIGRGVATTATYEARALGVHSAMGLMKAAKLAPDALLLPNDFDRYRHYSRLFKTAVRTVTPSIEETGIDEIYIDLTDAVDARVAAPDEGAADDEWWHARALAQAIKDAVHAATGLSCSIGIARNKLLAKIASDLDKPDGMTILREADLERRIWPLPVRKIKGIGPKAALKLQAMGIGSIGELARTEVSLLIDRFGPRYGAFLHHAAHGRDLRPVILESERKSLSRETTFERDLHAVHDRALLSRIFTDLCERVSEDLIDKGVAAKTIGLKLRFGNFQTVTRDQTLSLATQDAQIIRNAAGQSLKRVALTRRIRLLGIRAAKLSAVETLKVTSPVACASDAVAMPPTLFDPWPDA